MGFAAALRVAWNRCDHFTTEATLTPNVLAPPGTIARTEPP